jgi:hypothetical protein
MINSIRDWHYKATRKNVGTLAIFDSRFDIEPPDEIKTAVRALKLSGEKRKPLTGMVDAIHYTPSHAYHERYLNNAAISVR